MHSPRNTENAYTPAEQKIFDAMVAAVRVKHESWSTGRTYGDQPADFASRVISK